MQDNLNETSIEALTSLMDAKLAPIEQQLSANTQILRKLLQGLEDSGNDDESEKSQQLLESFAQHLSTLSQALEINNALLLRLLTPENLSNSQNR